MNIIILSFETIEIRANVKLNLEMHWMDVILLLIIFSLSFQKCQLGPQNLHPNFLDFQSIKSKPLFSIILSRYVLVLVLVVVNLFVRAFQLWNSKEPKQKV